MKQLFFNCSEIDASINSFWLKFTLDFKKYSQISSTTLPFGIFKVNGEKYIFYVLIGTEIVEQNIFLILKIFVTVVFNLSLNNYMYFVHKYKYLCKSSRQSRSGPLILTLGKKQYFLYTKYPYVDSTYVCLNKHILDDVYTWFINVILFIYFKHF